MQSTLEFVIIPLYFLYFFFFLKVISLESSVVSYILHTCWRAEQTFNFEKWKITSGNFFLLFFVLDDCTYIFIRSSAWIRTCPALIWCLIRCGRHIVFVPSVLQHQHKIIWKYFENFIWKTADEIFSVFFFAELSGLHMIILRWGKV